MLFNATGFQFLAISYTLFLAESRKLMAKSSFAETDYLNCLKGSKLI